MDSRDLQSSNKGEVMSRLFFNLLVHGIVPMAAAGALIGLVERNIEGQSFLGDLIALSVLVYWVLLYFWSRLPQDNEQPEHTKPEPPPLR